MERWTTGQDSVLREYGHLGAEECARMIREAFGVRRSVHAVQQRASRIGASLFEYSRCPRCGRLVRRLKASSGLCELCNERHWASAGRQRAELMRAMQPTAEDEEALSKARRERLASRQRRSRER